MMTAHKVTSEILLENDKCSQKHVNERIITEFVFKYPSYLIKPNFNNKAIKYDEDEDLDVDREQEGVLYIEHKVSTNLQLVGLQVWRGALLLADYILSNPSLFTQKVIIELGSGVGLTSIVASFLAKEVICTDINLGEILKLIERNFIRNTYFVKSKYHIEELNFLNLEWSESLKEKIDRTDIFLAADVIYDDVITDGFVATLEKLLNVNTRKIVYIALEKRYVFTFADLDTVAPMYEEFLRCIRRRNLNWNIEYIKIDFPRYFKYDRVPQMILMKIGREIVSEDKINN